MGFEFIKQEIPEIIIIRPKMIEDNRGFLMEIYKYSEFKKIGITEKFVQDNHSKSLKGVLRGLHFQKHPKAQGKLVRCLKGELFDVAVDIRKESPTYGKWVSAILSEENKEMIWIPKGFAHGFLAISNEAEIQYKITEEYSAENDQGIIWNDKTINISWPINNPILSKKDCELPELKNIDNNFIY